MKFNPSRLAGLAAVAALLASGGVSHAQSNFPDKPITIVVPRSAGGGADQLSRLIAPEWGKELKADFVIENIPGAGGAIALTEVFRRPADGYTVVTWSPPSEFVLQLQGRLSSTINDWVVIGATNSDPGVVAVPLDSKFKSFKDIIEASKTATKRLAVATIGRTTGSALSAMMYQSAFDVNWGLVPFDGGSEIITALVGGHTDFAIRQGGMYDLHPKQINILAIAAKERIAELPDVPTIKEATGKDIVYSAYRGFAVRKDTPPEIVEKLRKTFAVAAQSKNVVDKQFQLTGFRYEFLDADRFQKESDNQAAVADKFKNEILGK